MKHERLPRSGSTRSSARPGAVRVDVGVAGVVEHPEQPVEAHIDARRLDESSVERVQREAPAVDGGMDVAVGEQHTARLSDQRAQT